MRFLLLGDFSPGTRSIDTSFLPLKEYFAKSLVVSFVLSKLAVRLSPTHMYTPRVLGQCGHRKGVLWLLAKRMHELQRHP